MSGNAPPQLFVLLWHHWRLFSASWKRLAATIALPHVSASTDPCSTSDLVV